MKLAFADGMQYIADPRYMRTKVEAMLSEEYAAKRRALIGEQPCCRKQANRSAAALFICVLQITKEIWFPLSKATTKTLAVALCYLVMASTLMTEAQASAWTNLRMISCCRAKAVSYNYPRLFD